MIVITRGASVGTIHYVAKKEWGMELIVSQFSSRSYPVHNHVSVFTVGVMLQGRMDLSIAETLHRCKAGSSFIIAPYVPHAITARGTYSLLSVCINKQVLALTALPVLEKRMLFLLQDIRAAYPIGAGLCASLMASLKTLEKQQISAPFSDTSLQKLVWQLEQYPEQPFPVDTMAQIAGVSKYHLIRRFKALVGLTPHQFLIQNRVRKAQSLLKAADTLTEVALNAGFYDQSHFIRHFRHILRMTPTAYQAACTAL